MKKSIAICLSAFIMAQAATIPAGAVTREPPEEYKHTVEESVENDKAYMYASDSTDTGVCQVMLTIADPSLYYGFDDDGNIYVKEQEPQKKDDRYHPPFAPFGDPLFEPGADVEAYIIENGKRKLMNSYNIENEESDHWIRGLKPYTTYTVQSKLKYELGYVKDENGKEKAVVKEQWSDPIKLRTCPKKTSFTYSKAGKHTIRLRWKTVKCEGYKLQKYNSKKKSWSTIRNLPKSKTSAKLTGLKADSKYKFRVVPYGRVADKRYPRTILKEGPTFMDITFYYSTALFAKPSKAVTIKTKK